jgi:hypothetical protein
LRFVLQNEILHTQLNDPLPISPSRDRLPNQKEDDGVNVVLDLGPSINRLRPLAPGPNTFWAFRMDQWAPIASPDSVEDTEPSNAGYAVDAFAVRQPAPATTVTLELAVAVRGVDDALHRIGFHVSLTGRLVAQPVGP